jgi:hypothetical protein
LIGNSAAQTRLCPNCANSIAEDATSCPYCKVDLLVQSIPRWLKRGESSSEPRSGSGDNKRFPIPPMFIWIGAMVAVALIAFFAGGYMQHSQLVALSQANSRELQAKNQMIQSQEAQLAQTRQQLNDNSNQVAEIKTKLEESQKELSATQQQLKVATSEIARLKASRAVAVARSRASAPAMAAPLPAPARSRAEPGVYETTRATSVYEDPSAGSRVVSQIRGGTRINVVGSSGNWLQVQSRHGNPPGYVRSDDARLVARAN